MTGPTHKQFAVSGAFVCAIILYKYSLTAINYYLALSILILEAEYGGKFSDVDHHWSNVKDKTVPNFIINTLIHLTGGKHRSWQTHSIDIVVVCTLLSVYTPNILYELGVISLVNMEVLYIVVMGFMSGWISHIFSDMLTSAGVRLFCFSNRKVELVPKNIGKLRFNTGNEWEAFVYRLVKKINLALGFVCVTFPLLDWVGLIDRLRQMV